MVIIPTSRSRQLVVAGGKPSLGYAPQMKIVGRSGAAHLCRYPSRLQSIGFDVFPAASYGKGEQNIAKLALRVCRKATPGSLNPEQIVHVRSHAAVCAGADIDETSR